MSSRDQQQRKKPPLPTIAEDAVTAERPTPRDDSATAKRNDESEEVGKKEIWFREDERWELTWPIWHMLPREERKKLAHQYGFKTIGEFEENMTLQRALDDTLRDPYDNELVYSSQPSKTDDSATSEDKRKAKQPITVEEYEEDDDSDKELEEEIEKERGSASDKLTDDELRLAGGQILMLHDELLHRTFSWLPVDTYATLALVSPHWKSFTRTEAVYKRLCERLYLNQSRRRALHVSRFGNSYRTMLERRPRVRAGGGVYVMKHARVKQIQRDMWTEVPVGAVLETVYFRYLYFFENGRVLYALTSQPPHEMFPRFLKMCLYRPEERPEEGDSIDKAAVWGTYQVQKCKVMVQAKQPWQYVRLELSIKPENTMHGRYGYLSFDRHETSISGKFDAETWGDRISYDVPDEPFRFIKDKRL
jgi:F-box protein 9